MRQRCAVILGVAGCFLSVWQTAQAAPPEPPSGRQRLNDREHSRAESIREQYRQAEAEDAAPRFPLVGTVVGPDEKPVERAEIDAIVWQQSSFGHSRVRHLKATSEADGSFRLERPAKRYTVHARTPDAKLAGIARVDETQSVVTIPMRPTATVRGRIVNQLEQPAADAQVQVNTLVYQNEQGKMGSNYPFSKAVQTDADGRFEIVGLIPGGKYNITLLTQAGQKVGISHRLGDVTPKDDRPIELGERSFHELRTREESTAAFFRIRGPLAERLKLARIDAGGSYLHILLIVAEPAGKRSEDLHEYLDTELATLNDFIQVPISADDVAAVTWLREEYGAAVADLKWPALVALDANVTLLGAQTIGTLVSGDVRTFVAEHMPPALDARQLMAVALAQAKQDNKRVWVQETGTYCGPCHRLWRYLVRNRGILDSHFVFLNIDSLRLEHGDEVTKPFHRTPYQGIPWIVVLDAHGQPLGDSEGDGGKNFGYPSLPADVDRFFKLIADTAPGLTPEQIEELRADFSRPAP
jgi:hypothetical protein